MKCYDLFFKVEVDLEDDEDVRKLGQELARTIERLYGVRRAELQNVQPLNQD